MDQGLSVPEEHGSVVSDNNCDLSEIKVWDWDRYNVDLVPELVGLFYEFYSRVNDEDLSYEIAFTPTLSAPAIEAMFYKVLEDGAKVKFITSGSEIIGLMTYHTLFDCICIIRHMIIEPKYSGQGLAKVFVNSVSIPVKRVIFQTRKASKEFRVHEITTEYRKPIFETPEMTTWEMEWRGA